MTGTRPRWVQHNVIVPGVVVDGEERATAPPEAIVMSKIYYIRGHKVMLDEDLAGLYDVETKQLKRQVRRNIDRFPGRLYVRTDQGRVRGLEEPNWHLKLGRDEVYADGVYLVGLSDHELDQALTQKILDIQALGDEDSSSIIKTIDALLRDAKARKAYAH
jgi:hypothetical protein